MKYLYVPVTGEKADTHDPDAWVKWGEETRELLQELKFLHRVRTERAKEMQLAEKLFKISRDQLLEIKIKVHIDSQKSQSSTGFFPGNSLFCTQ